jgi:hypothetical protein
MKPWPQVLIFCALMSVAQQRKTTLVLMSLAHSVQIILMDAARVGRTDTMPLIVVAPTRP